MGNFDAGTIEARLTVDRSPFTTGLATAKGQAEAFERGAGNIEVDIDTNAAEANAELAATGAAAESLDGRRIDIWVDRRGNIPRATRQMGLLGTSILMLAPLASPAFAGVTAGVVGLSASLAAAGGAAVGFGAVAIPVAQRLAEHMKAAAEEGAAIPRPYREAARALNTLKDAFNGLVNRNQGMVLGIFTQAFRLMTTVVRQLDPVVRAAGGAIRGLLNDLQGWADSGGLQGMIQFLADNAGQIRQWGRILGNLALGFGRLFSAFMPFAAGMSQGLVNLTARFAEWAGSLAGSNGFQRFIDYVTTQGPVLLSMLGDVIMTLIHVGEALAPLAPITMAVVSGIAAFIQAIPPPVLTAIAAGVMAIVAAMRLMSIVRMVTTGIYLLTGAQWALNAAMYANPIGLIIGLIVALVAVFIIAYKKSATFRKIVQAAFQAVMGRARALWAVISNVFRMIGTIVVTQARIWLAILRGAWNTIRAVVRGAVAAVRNFIRTGFNVIRTIVQTVMNVIRAVISGNWRAIPGIISSGVSRVVGFIRSGFGRFVDIIRSTAGRAASAAAGVVGDIAGAIRDGIGTLFQAGRDLIGGLVDGIKSMIGAVGDAAGAIGGKIAGFLPGSPVKEGPLVSWNNGGAGKRLVNMLASGLVNTAPVDSAMRTLAGATAAGLPAIATPGAAFGPARGQVGSDATLGAALDRLTGGGGGLTIQEYNDYGSRDTRALANEFWMLSKARG